jgi:hypothetical protein
MGSHVVSVDLRRSCDGGSRMYDATRPPNHAINASSVPSVSRQTRTYTPPLAPAVAGPRHEMGYCPPNARALRVWLRYSAADGIFRRAPPEVSCHLDLQRALIASPRPLVFHGARDSRPCESHTPSATRVWHSHPLHHRLCI